MCQYRLMGIVSASPRVKVLNPGSFDCLSFMKSQLLKNSVVIRLPMFVFQGSHFLMICLDNVRCDGGRTRIPRLLFLFFLPEGVGVLQCPELRVGEELDQQNGKSRDFRSRCLHPSWHCKSMSFIPYTSMECTICLHIPAAITHLLPL